MPPPRSVDRLDDWAKARARWLMLTAYQDPARDGQLTPDDPDWLIWLILAGRGYGKTRTGAEDVSDYARTHPGERIAGVFDTFAAGRDVGVEGDSGILSVVPRSCVENWNRSLGQLTFTNGARFDLYSAEKPDSLRGPQHHRAWVDELAKFRYLQETWDQLMFGLRLGANPQCVITTTPKPLAILRDLMARATTRVTRGSTFDNARNLSPAALEELRLRYEGTRLGFQELHGEILEDFEGALWKREDILRLPPLELPPLPRIAIGLDPSTWGPEFGQAHASMGRGIETGIVAVGITDERPARICVLEDLSMRASPNDWGAAAVAAYHRLHATAIVVEANNAGWVGSILKGIDPNVHLVPVHARQAKRIRAEPVAAVYEQARGFHVGRFPELEDAMCSWDPGENWSPDRIDALVHAVTWLGPWEEQGSSSSLEQLLAGRIPTR